jgi:glycosidase
VLGNHDEARIASRVGPEGARLAMLLLLTLRGTPTLYQGDELGIQDVPIPPERAQDPWGKHVPGLNLGRDSARTPMPWNRSQPNAGFCPPDVEPWLPLNPDRATVNVQSELEDPGSLLALTRRLLAVRRATPALSVGGYRALDDAPEGCFLFVRDEQVLVALNFSTRAVEVRLPEGELLVSTSTDHQQGRLGPAEGRVVRLAGPLR